MADLAAFDPLILNHLTLNNLGYLGGPISDNARKQASEEHRRLRAGIAEGLPEDRLLKRLMELLYTVRSNVAHGEKTPYGPDVAKKERDESVSAVVAPLLDFLVDLALDRPSWKLVVYGTLAPGEANAHILEPLLGEWRQCTVVGTIKVQGQYKTFEQSSIGTLSVQLLTTPQLQEFWVRLDDFEGQAYARVLVDATCDDGRKVANIYARSLRDQPVAPGSVPPRQYRDICSLS